MLHLKCALIRALKTMTQTALALIGSNSVAITEIHWLHIILVSATSGIVSLLTSFAFGLPEAKTEGGN